MSEPVLEPGYWKDKLYDSFRAMERHRAIFTGSIDEFQVIEKRQQEQLKVIGQRESVIDIGCGYGRLLDLMPKGWRGQYFGIDLSPDLIDVARRIWPKHNFVVADLTTMDSPLSVKSDWAVAVWVKTMMIRNGYKDQWNKIHTWMRYNAINVLVID